MKRTKLFLTDKEIVWLQTGGLNNLYGLVNDSDWSNDTIFDSKAEVLRFIKKIKNL